MNRKHHRWELVVALMELLLGLVGVAVLQVSRSSIGAARGA